jgi:hypothetical protein
VHNILVKKCMWCNLLLDNQILETSHGNVHSPPRIDPAVIEGERTAIC